MTAAGRRRYAVALWLLLGLFVLRVAGQLLIAVGAGGFLPPWEEWFSGALGYPLLLASQILIIVVCGRIALDVTRGRGFFAAPRRQVGDVLLALGSVSFGVMVIRIEQFPRYDRNLNTGAPIATATVTTVARQAVHHGPQALSRIVLRVVPSGPPRSNKD